MDLKNYHPLKIPKKEMTKVEFPVVSFPYILLSLCHLPSSQREHSSLKAEVAGRLKLLLFSYQCARCLHFSFFLMSLMLCLN